MPPELKRFNMRMTMEMHDWFKSEAEKMGLPTANLVIMVLSNYMEGKKGIKAIDYMNQHMEGVDKQELIRSLQQG